MNILENTTNNSWTSLLLLLIFGILSTLCFIFAHKYNKLKRQNNKLKNKNEDENSNGAHEALPPDDGINANSKASFKKEKQTVLPPRSWFATNKINVKEIPIHKKVLRKYSTDQKTVIALTTYPTLIRNAFIVLAALVVGIIAVPVTFAITKDDKAMEGIIVLVVLFFGGSFVMQRLSGVFDGFSEINGTKLIQIPTGFKVVFYLARPIGMLWGGISQMIFIMFSHNEKVKMLNMPRVVMPQNCGFDKVIQIYSAYEASCNIRDNLQISADKNAEDYNKKSNEYKRLQSEGNKLKKSIEGNTEMSFNDKYSAIQKIEHGQELLTKKQNENTENYKEAKSEIQDKIEDYDNAKNELFDNL